MQGNINKQLASLALLLLLLVAVSIPVMATEGDEGATEPSEGYSDGSEGYSDGSEGEPTDVPPADDGETIDLTVDDTVSSDEDAGPADNSLSDAEKGDFDEELIYATAYGANCRAGTCNVNTACQESKPTTPTTWPCTEKAKDTGCCVKKTAKAPGTCAKSTCAKS